MVDATDDAPDLERFLKAAAPTVRHAGGAASVANLTLSDVWKFYEQPSVFGLECPALGGPRGPSTCYFVPYLSAVHLYYAVDDVVGSCSSGSGIDEEEVFSFPQGLDSWPQGMRRGFSWAATEHVADRLPVHTLLADLAARDMAANNSSGSNSSSGSDDQASLSFEQHPLWSTKLVDLHPYSWFAVAWYPLYRIPDAPLTARFLTFHSLAPLWEAATAAKREVKEAAEAAAAAERSGGSATATMVASYKLMLESGGGVGRQEEDEAVRNVVLQAQLLQIIAIIVMRITRVRIKAVVIMLQEEEGVQAVPDRYQSSLPPSLSPRPLPTPYQ